MLDRLTNRYLEKLFQIKTSLHFLFGVEQRIRNDNQHSVHLKEKEIGSQYTRKN